jgi:crotonobetainyl-CoA:carnitine CoA-transferase CaiB-like acyl-CoA transferase
VSARLGVPTTIAVAGSNAAIEYATEHLESFGVIVVRTARHPVDGARTVLCPADALDQSPIERLLDSYAAVVAVSDYQTGMPGSGELAAAAAGLSWVIGEVGGTPRSVPQGMPERWTGAVAASLALAWDGDGTPHTPGVRIDVSAANIVRSFVDQCAGNSAEVEYAWRRNGRLAVEHGGVFPQGFFRCRDGYVAIVARSRGDWEAILVALGNPDWAESERFRNPIALSRDDSEVAPLLEATTLQFSRRELLDRALAHGATMAPVLAPGEAAQWGLVAAAGALTPFYVHEDHR